MIEVLSPQHGEQVLDVGCGNGALSLAVAEHVGASGGVTGLDISGPMLACARARAEEAELGNLQFVQGDAQDHPLPESAFDGLVSRFGVMFFGDPVAAFTNLSASLTPGGRLAFACWRELLVNDWLMVPAGAALEHVSMPDLGEPGAPGPFSLSEPDRIERLLGDADFTDARIEEVTAPMLMGADVEDTVQFLASTEMADLLLADADPATAEAAWDSVRRVLRPYAGDDGLHLNGSAWVVTGSRSGP